MSAPAEIELKLTLDPKQIGSLKRRIGHSAAERLEVEIDNVYFDTPDRLLHRHRMALRLRSVDGRWLQTLKTAPEIEGALTRRGEWETEVRVARGLPRIELAELAASPLPALLERHRARRALRPVFRTQFRRTLWRFDTEAASIEVALDVGQITTSRGGKTVSEPLCEVELELKQGAASELYGIALRWIDSNRGRPLALRPALFSKAERGYRLLAGARATPAKAGAAGFAARLAPQMTIAEALRAVIAHGTFIVLANSDSIGAEDDPEFVHQARVALRRMRSAVRLLDDEHRDLPAALAAELRWFARALGAARDWDVIAVQTLPALFEAVRGSAQAALAQAGKRRLLAHARAQRAVASARYARLMLELERWSRSAGQSGSMPLVASAAPRLQRVARRLFKAARSFSELGPAGRHQVRILAKRLRYALDLHSVVLPRPETARYVEALADLQDVLGELNDAAVAAAALPALTRSKALARAVARKRRALDAAAVPSVEARLAALRKLDAPWRGKQRAGIGAKSA